MAKPPSRRGVDRVSETGGVFVQRYYKIYAYSSTAIAEPPRGGSLTHWFSFIYNPFVPHGQSRTPVPTGLCETLLDVRFRFAGFTLSPDFVGSSPKGGAYLSLPH